MVGSEDRKEKEGMRLWVRSRWVMVRKVGDLAEVVAMVSGARVSLLDRRERVARGRSVSSERVERLIRLLQANERLVRCGFESGTETAVRSLEATERVVREENFETSDAICRSWVSILA